MPKNTKPQIFCRNYCNKIFTSLVLWPKKRKRKRAEQKDFLQNFKITALWMLANSIIKKFQSAWLLSYMHKYCLILCRVQTDRDRERPADDLGGQQILYLEEKKEDRKMKKPQEPMFSGKRAKKRKERMENFWLQTTTYLKIPMFVIDRFWQMSVLQSVFFLCPS